MRTTDQRRLWYKKSLSSGPFGGCQAFEANGIQYLHLVDLDGARSHRIVNHRVLEKICNRTHLKVDFGGGLKSDEDLAIAFDCGASQITGGSIAVHNPAVFTGWINRYGGEKIVLGADCNQRKIATNGWQKQSSEDVLEFIQRYEVQGIQSVICTDISKDGMLSGSSEALYAEILRKTKVRLIASGGVASVDDLYALEKLGCEGAIVGKAIYEGLITLKQLSSLC